MQGTDLTGGARPLDRWLRLAGLVVLAGCGGGSGDGGNDTPRNRPPTVSAGSDRIVLENTLVSLDGLASDPDNDTLTYAWSQLGGSIVTLDDATQASTSFTAPDVAPATAEALTFRLTVSDGNGGTSSDDVVVTVQEPGEAVVLSGIARYEFPPPVGGCRGLDFGAVEERPIRGATVQIVDPASNALLASTRTDDSGFYSVTLEAGIDVFVRVVSELKQSGSVAWDVDVRNNVVDPNDPSPPPRPLRPKYFLDSAPFSTGVVNLSRDLLAETGWTGSAYGNLRAAAPFAILDTIYDMMQLVLTVEPAATFPPLDAYWSPENRPARSDAELVDDIDSGLIGTSFYSAEIDSLFLLGADGEDAEEFDAHVIAHEWGHYFEDQFARSDSIGGAHALGDELDKRVAFGEGFATALAGIALDDPLYCDTLWSGQTLSGFDINLESESPGANPGWFNEVSILKLLWDLWDDAEDGADTMSIGFAPVYDVMTGAQRTTPAFTSAFSFFAGLKALPGAETAFIDALLNAADITAAGINEYGDGEQNDGPGTPADVLPIYTDIAPGETRRVCSNSQFDPARDGNKLSEVRFLRMSLTTSASVGITVDTVNPPSQPSAGFDCDNADPADPEISEHSDPDIQVWQNGQALLQGWSCQPNREVIQPRNLAAGTYVMDLTEFRYADPDTPSDYPEQTCFDVTITQ